MKLPPVIGRAKQFAITFSVVASLGFLSDLSALDFLGYLDAESGL